VTRLDRIALIAALLAVLAIAWATRTHSAPTHFHIESGNACLTLNEFSRQSSVQILFDFNVVGEESTGSIDGDFEPQEALAALLKDSPLIFDWVNSRTIAVTARADVSIADRTARELVREVEWTDENGYIDCAPLRYTLTLLWYTQPRWDGKEICLLRGARVAQVERP
jgi:hypothetical protein